MLDVGDIGYGVDQGRQVGRAAGLLGGPGPVELFLERQQVDLGGPLEELQHSAVDPPVRVGEEILLRKDRHDGGERGGIEQYAPQDGALRPEVLRKAFLDGDVFEHSRKRSKRHDSFIPRDAMSTSWRISACPNPAGRSRPARQKKLCPQARSFPQSH